MAKERQTAKETSEKRHKEASERSKQIFEALRHADEKNAYLARKGVSVLGGVRQHEDGRLVIPVLDSKGNITSLQYIAGDSQKRFPKVGTLAEVAYMVSNGQCKALSFLAALVPIQWGDWLC